MPRVRFELTISVFERGKTVHALECVAAVIRAFEFLIFVITNSHTGYIEVHECNKVLIVHDYTNQQEKLFMPGSIRNMPSLT
jgi:hypothetical protein